ncbi:TRAP transporter small permease [Saccharopolyspora dendranthemae]|uniref:TRAP-type C4-dicarboxylate transport system permease small subunit n=1 Tax=Saccharopolyspora dendranthemae TaxID=1181886 RepID=A0A561U8W4_9PSEU|nr:TRAP transporter small permease [Saccharopolyspora dendranthemae]TWF95793.1 TRAP-type C4-dicarboxylate transport system permease small subunit [Saccharopolyspora dendranthemae]
MLDHLRRLVLIGTRSLAVLAMVTTGLMMLSISYDVIARYAFRAPTDWAYPLNSSAVLAVTVLAIPHLYATGHHISMDLVHRSLPPKLRRVADAVTALAAALLGLVLAVTGFQTVLVSYGHGLTGSGTFSVPLWIPDLILCASGAFLLLVAVLFPPHAEPELAATAAGADPAQDGANA